MSRSPSKDPCAVISPDFRLFATANMQRVHCNKLSRAFLNRMIRIWLPALDADLPESRFEGVGVCSHDTFPIVASMLAGVHGGNELCSIALAFHRAVQLGLQSGKLMLMEGFSLSFRTLRNACRSAVALISEGVKPPFAITWALERAYLGQVPHVRHKASLLSTLATIIKSNRGGPLYERLPEVRVSAPWKEQAAVLATAMVAWERGVRKVVGSVLAILLTEAHSSGADPLMVGSVSSAIAIFVKQLYPAAVVATMTLDTPEGARDALQRAVPLQLTLSKLEQFDLGDAGSRVQTLLGSFVRLSSLSDAHHRRAVLTRVRGAVTAVAMCLEHAVPYKPKDQRPESIILLGLRKRTQQLVTGCAAMAEWFANLKLDQVKQLQASFLARLRGARGERTVAWAVQSQLCRPICDSYLELRKVLHFLRDNGVQGTRSRDLLDYGRVLLWQGLAWDVSTRLPDAVVFGDGTSVTSLATLDPTTLMGLECQLAAVDFVPIVHQAVKRCSDVLSTEEDEGLVQAWRQAYEAPEQQLVAIQNHQDMLEACEQQLEVAQANHAGLVAQVTETQVPVKLTEFDFGSSSEDDTKQEEGSDAEVIVAQADMETSGKAKKGTCETDKKQKQTKKTKKKTNEQRTKKTVKKNSKKKKKKTKKAGNGKQSSTADVPATDLHAHIASSLRTLSEARAAVETTKSELQQALDTLPELKRAKAAATQAWLASDATRIAAQSQCTANVAAVLATAKWKEMLTQTSRYALGKQVSVFRILSSLCNVPAFRDIQGRLSLRLALAAGLGQILRGEQLPPSGWPHLADSDADDGSSLTANALCAVWATLYFAKEPRSFINAESCGIHALECSDRVGLSLLMEECAGKPLSVVVLCTPVTPGCDYAAFSLLVIDRRLWLTHTESEAMVVHHYTRARDVDNAVTPHTTCREAVLQCIAGQGEQPARCTDNMLLEASPAADRIVEDPTQAAIALLNTLATLDFTTPVGYQPLRRRPDVAYDIASCVTVCQEALADVRRALPSARYHVLAAGAPLIQSQKLIHWLTEAQRALQLFTVDSFCTYTCLYTAHACTSSQGHGRCALLPYLLASLLLSANSTKVQHDNKAAVRAVSSALRGARVEADNNRSTKRKLYQQVQSLVPTNFASLLEFQRYLDQLEQYRAFPLTTAVLRKHFKRLLQHRTHEIKIRSAATRALLAPTRVSRFLCSYIVHSALHSQDARLVRAVAAFEVADKAMEKMNRDAIAPMFSSVVFEPSVVKPAACITRDHFISALDTIEEVLTELGVPVELLQRNRIRRDDLLVENDIDVLVSASDVLAPQVPDGAAGPSGDKGKSKEPSTGDVNIDPQFQTAVNGLVERLRALMKLAKNMDTQSLECITGLARLIAEVEALGHTQRTEVDNAAFTASKNEQLAALEIDGRTLELKLHEFKAMTVPKDSLLDREKHLLTIDAFGPVDVSQLRQWLPRHRPGPTAQRNWPALASKAWEQLVRLMKTPQELSREESKTAIVRSSDVVEITSALKTAMWQRCFVLAFSKVATLANAPREVDEGAMKAFAAHLSVVEQDLMQGFFTAKSKGQHARQAYVKSTLPWLLASVLGERRRTLLLEPCMPRQPTEGTKLHALNVATRNILCNYSHVVSLGVSTLEMRRKHPLSLLNLDAYIKGMHARRDMVEAALGQFVAGIPASFEPVLLQPVDLLCILTPTRLEAIRSVMEWQLAADDELAKPMPPAVGPGRPHEPRCTMPARDNTLPPITPARPELLTGLAAFTYGGAQGPVNVLGKCESQCVRSVTENVDKVLWMLQHRRRGVLSCLADSLPLQLWLGMMLSRFTADAIQKLAGAETNVLKNVAIRPRPGSMHNDEIEQLARESNAAQAVLESFLAMQKDVAESGGSTRLVKAKHSLAKVKAQATKAKATLRDAEAREQARHVREAHKLVQEVVSVLRTRHAAVASTCNIIRGVCGEVELPSRAAAEAAARAARVAEGRLSLDMDAGNIGVEEAKATTPVHANHHCSVASSSQLFEALHTYPTLPAEVLDTVGAASGVDRQDSLVAILDRLNERDSFRRAAEWVAALSTLSTIVVTRCLLIWEATCNTVHNSDLAKPTVSVKNAAACMLEECPPLIAAARKNLRADAAEVVARCSALMDGPFSKEISKARVHMEPFPVAHQSVKATSSFVANIVHSACDLVLRRQMVRDGVVRASLERFRDEAKAQIVIPRTGAGVCADSVDDTGLMVAEARLPSFANGLVRLLPLVSMSLSLNAFQLVEAVNAEIQQLGEYAHGAGFVVRSLVDKCVAPFMQRSQWAYSTQRRQNHYPSYTVDEVAYWLNRQHTAHGASENLFLRLLRRLVQLGDTDVTSCNTSELLSSYMHDDGSDAMHSLRELISNVAVAWEAAIKRPGSNPPFCDMLRKHADMLVKEALAMCVRKATLEFEQRRLEAIEASTVIRGNGLSCQGVLAQVDACGGEAVVIEGGDTRYVAPAWNAIKLADAYHAADLARLLQDSVSEMGSSNKLTSDKLRQWLDEPRLLGTMLPEAVRAAERLLLLLHECSPDALIPGELATKHNKLCATAAGMMHSSVQNVRDAGAADSVLQHVYSLEESFVMSKLKATFCRHLHATWLDAVGGWPSAAHGLETDAQYRQAVSGMHNLLARLQKLAQDWFEAGEAFIQARNNARDEKRKQVREEKRKYEEIKRTIQNHETLKKKLAEDLHALLRTLTNLTPLVEPQTLSEYVRVRCGC